MSTSRKVQAVLVAPDVGLLASGASGDWEVAVDEATSGPERWFMQIDGPLVSLYFEIPSLEVVADAIRLLEGNKLIDNSAGVRMELGGSASTRVSFVKDDEYDDRFFLVVAAEVSPRVQLVIQGADRDHLLHALRQASEDLSAEA
jgi:hypothetical protein